MPEHDHCESWNCLASFDDKIHHRLKVCLPSWHMARIDVVALEASEVQLARSDIIAVWALHEHWNSQLLEHIE